MISDKKKYDLVFIGLGAANSLIINALYSSNLLQHCSIAVIDPDPKTKNDKTYCFWASPEELEMLQLSKLTDRFWSKISCNTNEIVDITPLRYYHVSSISLYDHVKRILSNCMVDYYREHLINVEYNESENLILLNTESASFQSIKIFDSRPPEWKELKKHQSFLWQSFLGWKIKTAQPAFEKNVFTMMDFEVDQTDATQFVYILPYTDNHALVELTRFGVHGIDHDQARNLLEKYCSEKKWDITILEEEQGMIPMCSKDIIQRSVHINHIQTGTAAGKIKPTTGYAFKEMAKDAIHIAEDFSSGMTLSKQKTKLSRTGRFAFYDRLLLKILESYPKKGKLIFTSLFKKVDCRLVLKFLEEKTAFREEIAVMMSLPKKIFIQQALKDCISRLSNNFFYLLPLIATILLILLQLIGVESAGIILLSIGFLGIGIPHGAMDHILDKKAIDNLAVFTVKYLIKGAAIYLLWKLSPIVGLVTFLIYSAWHFGQADFVQWKLREGFSSFSWGLGMLIFLLCSHDKETGFILNQIFDGNAKGISLHLLPTLGYFFSLILMSYALIINRNKWLSISIATILLLSFLPLIQAFGIYFICQHSVNGWCQIKEKLKKTDFELWKQAFPFTIGAFILFMLLFFSFHLNWKEQFGSFFIFLSCISFPHVMNMHDFYRR